jgi:hypothetical protein
VEGSPDPENLSEAPGLASLMDMRCALSGYAGENRLGPASQRSECRLLAARLGSSCGDKTNEARQCGCARFRNFGKFNGRDEMLQLHKLRSSVLAYADAWTRSLDPPATDAAPTLDDFDAFSPCRKIAHYGFAGDETR